MVLILKAIGLILAMIAQQEAEIKNFRVLDEISGFDTQIDQPLAVLVGTEREFRQLWSRHRDTFGHEPQIKGAVWLEGYIPKIDFTKNSVVAYFGGESLGIGGYRVANLNARGKEVSFAIEPVPFGTQFGYFAKGYGMWIIPKPKKAISLEMLVGMDRNGPILRKIAKLGVSNSKPPGG